MFKKDITISSRSKLKSSQQRALRERFRTQFPRLTPSLDLALGAKNAQWDCLKLKVRGEENKELEKTEVHAVNLYVLPADRKPGQGASAATEPLFYETRDALVPHLRLVLRFPPEVWNCVRIDRGAIRFVLSGAKLAVPGLTSAGGRLPGPELEGEDLERYGGGELGVGEVVVVKAEGKEHACMVGTLLMGTEAMKREKKGYAMDDGHFLGDQLWSLPLD